MRPCCALRSGLTAIIRYRGFQGPLCSKRSIRAGNNAAVRPWLVDHLKFPTVLRLRLPVVIVPRSTHFRVPKPFPDLRDVGALVQSVRGGCCSCRMGTASVNADSDPLSVELQDLVNAVGRQRGVCRPSPIVAYGLKEGRGGEGGGDGSSSLRGPLPPPAVDAATEWPNPGRLHH